MTPERPRCPITPATKVVELLEARPELEPVLVAQAPAFRRLKSPVLRRTVPLPVVNEKARGLGPGELLRIDSGFRPAPLVESLSKQGFRTFVRDASPGLLQTFVARG